MNNLNLNGLSSEEKQKRLVERIVDKEFEVIKLRNELEEVKKTLRLLENRAFEEVKKADEQKQQLMREGDELKTELQQLIKAYQDLDKRYFKNVENEKRERERVSCLSCSRVLLSTKAKNYFEDRIYCNDCLHAIETEKKYSPRKEARYIIGNE